MVYSAAGWRDINFPGYFTFRSFTDPVYRLLQTMQEFGKAIMILRQKKRESEN